MLRGGRHSVMGVVATLVLLLGATTSATAQLRLIPQSKRDSVNSPTIDHAAGLRIVNGSRLSFGTIDEEQGSWHGEVELRNEGAQSLTITHIKSSCSCLTADFERGAIAPSQSATLRVTFDPTGRIGGVSQRLFIYTSASATTPAAILELEGRVRSAAGGSNNYPIACGGLLMQRRRANFGAHSRVERIACKNGSRRTLRITADTLFSSQGVALRCEPQRLEAGAEGELVITIDRERLEGAASSRPRLYLMGVDAPMRNREIVIEIANIEK